MKKKKIVKKLNYQPTNLQGYQLNDPIKVMGYFFADFPIHETRDNLWELYQGWVYNSSGYVNEQMITDMLCFFTQLREFVEATYVYTEMNKAK